MTHTLTAIAAFMLGCVVCWQFAKLRIRAKVNQSKRREKVWERIAKSATDDPIRWSLMMDRTRRELMR